ncbi:MAG: hypothetical protein AB1393_07145 [Candidatus Edwardsbacteria bacterium]
MFSARGFACPPSRFHPDRPDYWASIRAGGQVRLCRLAQRTGRDYDR